MEVALALRAGLPERKACFMGFFDALNDWILSLPTGIIYLVALMGAGIFLTFRLRFVQFRHFFRAFKDTFQNIGKGGGEGSISSFQATATALAGTLGTGNIIGVATAIVSGGPGAVFWMCVSSFFGMATKFSEIVLAVHFRTQNRNGETVGGPMYYIQNGIHSRWMAVIFSAACVGASFGVGNLSQSNAISDALYSTFGAPKWLVGLVVMAVIGLIIIGGIKRIGAVTERLVPIMALTYFIGSIAAIAVNWRALPEAFSLIFRDAFTTQSISGGVLGYLTSRAVRFGISRGVFSNEAGLGSAPIAHGAAQTDSAVRQGLWGIVEVFLDTILMCTMTTVVILTSGQYQSGATGAALTTSAFATALGKHAASFVAISTIFFAVASIVGWAYYGEKAIEFLSPKRIWVNVYRVCFVLSVFLGAVAQIDLIWNLSDLLNLIMAIPNIIAVVALSKIVSRESQSYFAKFTKTR